MRPSPNYRGNGQQKKRETAHDAPMTMKCDCTLCNPLKTSWGICMKCGWDRNTSIGIPSNWTPEMEARGKGQWLKVTCQCGYSWERPCEDNVIKERSESNGEMPVTEDESAGR